MKSIILILLGLFSFSSCKQKDPCKGVTCQANSSPVKNDKSCDCICTSGFSGVSCDQIILSGHTGPYKITGECIKSESAYISQSNNQTTVVITLTTTCLTNIINANFYITENNNLITIPTQTLSYSNGGGSVDNYDVVSISGSGNTSNSNNKAAVDLNYKIHVEKHVGSVITNCEENCSSKLVEN